LNGDANGAVAQLRRAIELDPGSVEYEFNLANVLESQGKFSEAIAPLERAVALSHSRDWRSLAELAKVYDQTARRDDALQAIRQALDAATRQNDQQAAKALQDLLDRYQRQSGHAKSD
jgi:tetratricopeptide (TPR) repeat protein